MKKYIVNNDLEFDNIEDLMEYLDSNTETPSIAKDFEENFNNTHEPIEIPYTKPINPIDGLRVFNFHMYLESRNTYLELYRDEFKRTIEDIDNGEEWFFKHKVEVKSCTKQQANICIICIL